MRIRSNPAKAAMSTQASALAGMLAAAAVAGCAAPSSLPRMTLRTPMSADAQAALDLAARQVRRCYRAPRVSSAGRQIITRIRVRVAPDGALNGLPEIVWQSGVSPANRPYAPRMAEAAILSVIRCAPYRLPPDFADGGPVEIDLTFSPAAAA